MFAQRERRQLKPGNPSFRARFQASNFFIRQCQSHHLLQKVGSFLAAQAQVCLAYLQHLSPRAQARQRERWIGATGQQHVQIGRKMLKHKLERIVNRLVANQVIIIQNQSRVLRKLRQFVDERSQRTC